MSLATKIIFTDQKDGGITAKKLNLMVQDLSNAIGSGGGGTGTGDMLKSTYDTNNNGVVDTADSLAWSRLTGVPATFAPSAHAPSHLDNGADPIPVVTTSRTGLTPKLSGTATTYLNGAGAYTTPPVGTGDMTKAVYDTNADNIVDHAALADAAPWTGITGKPTTFAPSVHAPSHLDNGADPIPVATTSRTGLLPVLNGNSATYLNGTGAFSSPASGGPPAAPNDFTKVLVGTGTGSGNWGYIVPSTKTTAQFTIPAIGSSVTASVDSTGVNCPFAIGQTYLIIDNQAHWFIGEVTAFTATSLTMINRGYQGTSAASFNIASGAWVQLIGPSFMTATQPGFVPTPPNSAAQYLDGTGHWSTPAPALARYYGTDTTNSLAYAVSVASDFTLAAGVLVWVTPSLASSGAPTLNVNATGAKPIVSRGNVALGTNEITVGKTFGVVYDGTSWRVVTPLIRWITATNPGATVTVNCAGFDAVNARLSGTGQNLYLVLTGMGPGVPIDATFINTAASSVLYLLQCYDQNGTAQNTDLTIPTTSGGSAIIAVQGGITLNASAQISLKGALNASGHTQVSC